VRGALDTRGYETWIYESGGEIAGFALLGAGDWLWEVRQLVAKHPRRGIGAFAMRHAISRAFEAGADRIFLEVVAENAGARALYERFGFVQEGCYRGGYRNDDGSYADLIPYGLLRSELPSP